MLNDEKLSSVDVIIFNFYIKCNLSRTKNVWWYINLLIFEWAGAGK